MNTTQRKCTFDIEAWNSPIDTRASIVNCKCCGCDSAGYEILFRRTMLTDCIDCYGKIIAMMELNSGIPTVLQHLWKLKSDIPICTDVFDVEDHYETIGYLVGAKKRIVINSDFSVSSNKFGGNEAYKHYEATNATKNVCVAIEQLRGLNISNDTSTDRAAMMRNILKLISENKAHGQFK